MVAVRSAVEVAPMHMAIVALTPGSMHLAVFVIAMDAAIDVTAVSIPMHMTMMIVVLIVILGLLQEAQRGLAEQAHWCCLGDRSHESQRNGATHQGYGLHR